MYFGIPQIAMAMYMGPLAQPVEQRPFKAEVTGSIPVRPRVSGLQIYYFSNSFEMDQYRDVEECTCWSPSSSGQDTGFSSRKQGFNSPRR